jgi:glycosyltransferase involved in cell wall biosynthesis
MNKGPLTILNVSQNYYMRGGSDRMFFATIDLLAQHGHKAIPFAAADPRNCHTDWDAYFPIAANFEQPAPTDLVRYIYSRPALRAVRKLISDCRPDLAHLHIYYGKLTSSILAPLKTAGVPIVQTLHEYKLICPVYSLLSNGQICEACQGHHYWRALPRKCNRASLARTFLSVVEAYASRLQGSVDLIDHFVAVSDFVRSKMVEHGIPAQRISTIHNFVETSKITPQHEPGKHFLYFGRLEAFKGLFTLLEAAAPLTGTPLLIVGEGSVRNQLAREIERRNLAHIRLLGFKQGEELKQIIGDSICSILPSEIYETLGLTVLETLAHARPVIASRIGGIPETIAEGRGGILFKAGDSKDLREKMIWMASHPNEAVEMGTVGRRTVKERFGPERYYEKLMDVYRRVR